MWIEYDAPHRHRPSTDRRVAIHRKAGDVVNATREEAGQAVSLGRARKVPAPARTPPAPPPGGGGTASTGDGG